MPVKRWSEDFKMLCQGNRSCLSSREDAAKVDGSELKVLDIAGIIILRLE
ncbi:MAG: hypothetical protein H8E29_07105 [Anaerolineales bacterium]|mgnify:CR=1 FL=1|uniref:Uncharacterized protein n=1 Tax=Candidatus Desulfolinea nitratireducens TaxID=2841698 RepID=A0A8J6NKU3_9CHLR|nr:hypothetical protein [Candidatus Desulfolinea nitratireducens]